MRNLNDIAEECDKAINSLDKNQINTLIQYLETKVNDNDEAKKKCYSHYLLGNLHHSLCLVVGETPSAWRQEGYPSHLTAEINHLRIAEALISKTDRAYENEIKTNLANALAMQRRNIEVLENWQCDFTVQGDAPYVSSMSKAKELIWISHWLNDPSHSHLYQYEAYRLLKKLKDHISNTNHATIINALNDDSEVKLLLEKGGEFFSSLENWKTSCNESNYSRGEKEYRAWCLGNKLFANPINDLTNEWIADQDILQFPNHTVSLNNGPYFSAAFSALKREFCFARFIAYEGFHEIHPSFEDQKLFLVNTLDYVHYSGSVEKIKTAFRISFSVLDSIAYLMNAYFNCGAKNASFSSRWIKNNFKDKDENYFIDALYWLACDLTDNQNLTDNLDKWKAPNPNAAEIRKTRNAIEHGWLRIAEREQSVWDMSSDFAHITTLDDLQRQTLFVLKLVRAAMLYLSMAVSYHEKNQPVSDGLVATMPIHMIDDDLISF